ncbi:MAG: hypothetical protein Ta2F_11740 [Termitinemataceae bacterium]|nr:MAG: hypothetical protein Ta2F_11740 [Termitinemataceae bacterium]
MSIFYTNAGRIFGIVLVSLLLLTSCGEAKPDIGAWIDEQLAKAREANEKANEEAGDDGEPSGEPFSGSQVEILSTDIVAAELITITVTGNYYYVEFTRADGSPCTDSRMDKTNVPIGCKTILDGISGNIAVAIVGDSGNSTTPFKLHLKDVNLAVNRVVSGEPLPAIRLKGKSGIYPNVELIIEGTNNEVVSNGVSTDTYRTHAGIFVPKGSKINIHGIDGNVSANKLTARGNGSASYANGAGIGGCWDPIEETAMAGSITIGSGVTVEAHGGSGAAGIGGGYSYDSGSEKIKIEGNAVVYAYGIGCDPGIKGGPGIGIGSNADNPSHTTVIEIAGEANVYASSSYASYEGGAGIGVGAGVYSSQLNAEIKIGGNAHVFARGGSQAAGIGTGYTSDYHTIRNLTLTIGNGSDNPVVAAISVPGYLSYPIAIGYAGAIAYLTEQNDINITINSGFVIAKSDGSTQVIGSNSTRTSPRLNVTTKITGGSVWLDNFNPDCMYPPAINAAGTLVYPLYLLNYYSGTDFWHGSTAKTITIADTPNYSAKTANLNVGAFIDSVNTLFGDRTLPSAMDPAAVLWVPAKSYVSNISIEGIAGAKSVDVVGSIHNSYEAYSGISNVIEP